MTKRSHCLVTNRFPTEADLEASKIKQLMALINVVVLGHFVMRVKATGKESRSEWAQVWTVKDGVITHMQEYVDTAAVSRAHTG